MFDEELCEIWEKRRAGHEWMETTTFDFMHTDVGPWAVGGIHFFFLPVQSRYCGDREGVYLRSLVVVDTFVRSQSHRVAGPL